MVIGLSGKIGSGKDFLSELIAENSVKHDVNVIAFADKLREVVESLSGYKRERTHSIGHPFWNECV